MSSGSGMGAGTYTVLGLLDPATCRSYRLRVDSSLPGAGTSMVRDGRLAQKMVARLPADAVNAFVSSKREYEVSPYWRYMRLSNRAAIDVPDEEYCGMRTAATLVLVLGDDGRAAGGLLLPRGAAWDPAGATHALVSHIMC